MCHQPISFFFVHQLSLWFSPFYSSLCCLLSLHLCSDAPFILWQNDSTSNGLSWLRDHLAKRLMTICWEAVKPHSQRSPVTPFSNWVAASPWSWAAEFFKTPSFRHLHSQASSNLLVLNCSSSHSQSCKNYQLLSCSTSHSLLLPCYDWPLFMDCSCLLSLSLSSVFELHQFLVPMPAVWQQSSDTSPQNLNSSH